MKFFKTLKRKAGNAILPVVGTIMGLTILAGSVVGVALNSSKIVYRKSNLEQGNDARQILYLAAKYFCTEINNGKTDTQIRQELQEIFGPGLKITKDTADPEKYYIWYPNRFVNASQKEYDPEQDNSQVAEWLKATIVKSEQSDDDGDHGNTGINNTLFSQEAKLDEKFAIGNMMTVYLTDEHLLPGRKYSINEVSLVESDIDTFDEAFTYMNNTGVLEIDDIAVALYKYGIVNGSNVSYINATDTEGKYEIVYKTGNLGGNYYWANNGTSTETWLYRQEYDIDLLYEMICYQDSANKSINKNNLKYFYDETNDSHKIYSTKTTDNYELVYTSSQRFAEAIADYIFWKNMPRLCMYLDDFVKVIKKDASQQTGYNYWRDSLGNLSWYEWKETVLTLRPWNGGSYYTEVDYTDSDVLNFFQTNTTLKDKYCTNGKLDRNKLYNALITKAKSSLISSNSDAIDDAYLSILQSKLFTERTNSYSYSKCLWYGYETVNYGNYTRDERVYYNFDSNKWNQNVINVQSNKDHILHKAVEAFLLKQLTIKYITGDEANGIQRQAFNNGSINGYVEELNTEGLKDFQWNIDNGVMYIYYRFGAYVKKANGQVDYSAPMSDETGDTFYFKIDGIYTKDRKKNWYDTDKYTLVTKYSYNSDNAIEGFVKTFISAFAEMSNVSYTDLYTEEELTKISREQVMKNLVNPLLYQYLPTSTLNSIVGNGDTVKYGMREQNIANKLLTFYLENGEAELKAAIGDLDYDINVTKIEYKENVGNCLDFTVSFKITVHLANGSTQDHTRKVSFLIQYMTYSGQNNALYNESTGTYTDVLNGNFITDTDSDGKVKHVFSPVVIKDNQGNAIDKADINANNIRAILSCVPYTERINSNQVPYGDHKITIDGVDYAVTTDKNALKNVTSNMLYDGDITSLGSDSFKIKVADGKSLFINGSLSLENNQQVELGANSLLFVNGDMSVRYNVTVDMRYDGSYWTRELWTSDYNKFVSNGVNIKAEENAKIMINGNFDYRGFKAKQAKKNSKGFNVYNAQTGGYDYVDTNVIYEQYVLNANFQDRYGNRLGECTQNEDGTWNHYPYECRGLLQGIYIINGDISFHAWDENNTTDNSNQIISMYRNMYSNPCINATFYVDGVFDMRGLYTSGLYDQCRSNFVFAKSIVEPLIALNTVLCQGSNTNYGAWNDNDGYLFMICEDAIDFSKVNFACVNLFTPFQELINAINANKQSATNFSEFIDKGTFTTMYPNKAVIDEWGLPSILRSGLGQLYDPGDIGAITPEDHIYGNPV